MKRKQTPYMWTLAVSMLLIKKNAAFLAILVFKEPMLCMFALESEIQKLLTKWIFKPCRCYLAGKVRILFHLQSICPKQSKKIKFFQHPKIFFAEELSLDFF